MTVICIGDSTTAGTPLFKSPLEAPPDGEGDEQSQFTWWLQQTHPEWHVLNRGVNGERSDQIAARFARDVIAQAPDVVVIIAGVNDVYQGLSAQHVIANLASMYDRARDAGIPVVAGTIVPYNTATPDQNARMHDINRWIADEVGHRTEFACVDTRAATADPADPDRLAASPDSLHPSIEGYRRMADALEPALVRLLDGRESSK